MIVDVVAAQLAYDAASLWLTADDAALANTALGSFTGLELVHIVGAGTYQTVAEAVAASQRTAAGYVPRASIVVLPDSAIGFAVGFGKCIRPAGRSWACIPLDLNVTRFGHKLPGVTYTGRGRP